MTKNILTNSVLPTTYARYEKLIATYQLDLNPMKEAPGYYPLRR